MVSIFSLFLLKMFCFSLLSKFIKFSSILLIFSDEKLFESCIKYSVTSNEELKTGCIFLLFDNENTDVNLNWESCGDECDTD